MWFKQYLQGQIWWCFGACLIMANYVFHRFGSHESLEKIEVWFKAFLIKRKVEEEGQEPREDQKLWLFNLMLFCSSGVIQPHLGLGFIQLVHKYIN